MEYRIVASTATDLGVFTERCTEMLNAGYTLHGSLICIPGRLLVQAFVRGVRV